MQMPPAECWDLHNETFEEAKELPPEEVPFGFQVEEYLTYATTQFTKRLTRIERARRETVEQIYQEDEEEERGTLPRSV
jgi:ribonucleoside-diphosphate reductase beta chain